MKIDVHKEEFLMSIRRMTDAIATEGDGYGRLYLTITIPKRFRYAWFRYASHSTRRHSTQGLGLVFATLLLLVTTLVAHADRSSENIDPAYMFEKKGRFSEAAVYYHRTLRGLREVYIAFHWDNDPAKYAAGKYATEYVKWPKEVEDRYQKCLKQAKMTKAQRKHMEFINDVWMSELVDFEGGGQRQNWEVVYIKP